MTASSLGKDYKTNQNSIYKQNIQSWTSRSSNTTPPPPKKKKEEENTFARRSTDLSRGVRERSLFGLTGVYVRAPVLNLGVTHTERPLRFSSRSVKGNSI